MLVAFVEGKTGPMAWTSHGVAFPVKDGPKPNVGEIWYVEPAGTNPKGTVTFLKLVKKAENGVMISYTPENQKPFEWATRVAGPPLTSHVIAKLPKVNDEVLAPKLVRIISLWDDKTLKERVEKGSNKQKQKQQETPTEVIAV